MKTVGSVEDCLVNFSSVNHFNTPERKAIKLRNEVSKLLGISPKTGHTWFGQLYLPKGEGLVRLLFFLRLCGYEIPEQKDMPQFIRELSDQIAIEAVSVNDVASYIGTSKDVVVDILMLRYGTSAKRKEQIEQLVAAHRPEEQRKLTEWKAKIASLGLAGQAKPEKVVAQVPEVSTIGLDNEQAVKMLAQLILAIKPLTELVLSEECSAKNRQQLRELTATNGHSNAVFEVANALNRLCGERARKEIP